MRCFAFHFPFLRFKVEAGSLWANLKGGVARSSSPSPSLELGDCPGGHHHHIRDIGDDHLNDINENNLTKKNNKRCSSPDAPSTSDSAEDLVLLRRPSQVAAR